MDRPLLYNYFDKKAEEILKKFETSAQQKSSRNIGDNREIFLNEFLKTVLPPKLHVKNGEIWDKTGFRTGQIDSLIIRDDAPSLDFGGNNAYLAEGVFAVIEVKSNLSLDKLKEAANVMKNIEKLQIPQPTITVGGHTLKRPLRLVFAYNGASFDTITGAIDKNGWAELFDLICILDKGIFVRKGRLIYPYDKTTGEKFEKDIILETKASALSFLYYYLVQYGIAFSSGSMTLEEYFQPLESWGK